MADSERFQEGEGEEEKLMEGMAVLDFDMLCSTVALQAAQGKWRSLGGGGGGAEGEDAAILGDLGGGVLRMWEGEVVDCFEDRRIALQSSWSVFLSSLWVYFHVSVMKTGNWFLEICYCLLLVLGGYPVTFGCFWLWKLE